MEQHRTNPLCSSCHSIMDPIGFGLENFDAIGDYRTADANNLNIDASGTLITGESFTGAIDLAKVLSTSRRQDFLACFSEKMLTYALGRGVDYYDRPPSTRSSTRPKNTTIISPASSRPSSPARRFRCKEPSRSPRRGTTELLLAPNNFVK